MHSNNKSKEHLLVDSYHTEKMFFNDLINSIPDLIFYKDLQGRYLGVNTAFQVFCGKDESEIIGLTDFDLFDRDVAGFFRLQDKKMLSSKVKRVNEEWIDYPDGRHVLLETVKTPVLDANNKVLGLIGISRDITQHNRIETLLRGNETRFRELLDSMPNIAIQGYNRNREVIYWNLASEALYGYLTEEAFGKKIEQLIIPDEMKLPVLDAISQWYEKGIPIEAAEMSLKNKNGDEVPVHSSHVMLHPEDGDAEMFCIDIDLTEQRNVQKELEQLANFDQLTNLPNRTLFLECFEQSLHEAQRFKKIIAVIFMDLDNFKYINDTFGHEIGDELLIQVAKRLTSALRKYDLISRFGGDEFVIALPYLDKDTRIAPLVEKLQAEFDYPFELNGHSSYITCSMGISLYPDGAEDASSLLKYADIAMYKAKENGRNKFHFFNEAINHRVNRQIELSNELINAIENNEFSLLFQPQIELSSGKIVACEALLRWHNKNLGDIAPAEFIPVAEQSNLINKIDFWVLEQIAGYLDRWIKSGVNPVCIFANFSERGFSDNIFLAKLTNFINAHPYISRYLGIELSEQVLLKTGEQTNQLLDFLHENGISLALDNFGAGYSSIAYLKNSPIDRIKIGKQFIDKAAMDGHEEAFIHAMIAVSRALSIQTIAVGIEDQNHQQRFIEQSQCEMVQGFFYHQPMAAEKLAEMLSL